MISLGNCRFWRPQAASKSLQTEPKISWASLISRSLNLLAAAFAGGGVFVTSVGGIGRVEAGIEGFGA
jgi:hypothetical protein